MDPRASQSRWQLLHRIADLVTTHSKLVIGIMLVLSLVLGAGVTQLDESAGLDQFEFDTEEGDALDYISTNFDVDANETNVQVVLRDQENALSRESFLATLSFQQAILDDPRVNQTLEDDAVGDLASIIATEAIAKEEQANLEARGENLSEDQDALVTLAGELSDGLNATRELQTQYEELNASFEAGAINESTYSENATALENQLAAVEAEATESLSPEQATAYSNMLSDARTIQSEIVRTELAYQAGDIDEMQRDAEMDRLAADMEEVYELIESDILADAFTDLEERAEALEADERALAELDPTLDEQQDQLASMGDAEVESLVGDVLGEDAPRGVFVFLPTDFEPGDTSTDARQVFITQQTDQDDLVAGEAPDRIVDSQLVISDHVRQHFGDRGFTFGLGIITDEIDRSMGDSLALVFPLALLFVIVVLTIAYRDPLDIILGLGGIGFVLLWTFGFMGWTGMIFNQIMIAVPVLLVGLSIDYAIHVFMRHRERRAEGGGDTRDAMHIVILGLGAALVWVTITAVIGFLSNLVSPVTPIRDFGIISAFGIFSTLVIFGVLIPASKVFLDSFLESRGFDRRKRAFGTSGGRLTRVLQTGNFLAQRMPVVVLLLVLLITSAGVYGATQVDTEFNQEDFIADDPADWMDRLPSIFAPGEYTVKSGLDFVNERFIRQDATTQVLVRGDLTSDDALERIAAGEATAANEDVVIVLSDGEPDVQSVLTSMEQVADQNESFAAVYEAADTTGDNVPNQDVSDVYDAYFDAAPEEATRFLYRTDDGTYEATRLQLSIEGDASGSAATDATRRVSASIADDDRTAVATGQLVVFHVIEDGLFQAVLESLLVTFIAVFLFLMVAYRYAHGSALLGAVTLFPIVLTVAWILGTMHLLEIPFNVMTGTITSLTIGLGVAYNIHICERYRLEVGRGYPPETALQRAVTGTGGALLGSAATTVGGFGVLIFAILPPLQQFGIITGLTIIYAFLGSVFVLPSFLALWTRFLSRESTE